MGIPLSSINSVVVYLFYSCPSSIVHPMRIANCKTKEGKKGIMRREIEGIRKRERERVENEK